MLHRGVQRTVWLLFALLVAEPRAAAEDDAVHVACDTLAAEDAAQIEARTRATLLTSSSGNLKVLVECNPATATVLVSAGERFESTTLTLPGEHAREALLAAIESTLAALERNETGATATFPGEPVPLPETKAPPPAPAKAVIVPRTAPAPVAVPPPRERPSWCAGVGVVGERWDGAFGWGARLFVEHRRSPWSIGAAFGWLTASPGDDEFRANELHAVLFGALEDRKLVGLRGSVGAGLSVLSVTPNSDLIVRSPTMAPLAFADVWLSRPLRFGHASLLPAAGLRIFPGTREVLVDQQRRLALPPLCPTLFLGFSYET